MQLVTHPKLANAEGKPVYLDFHGARGQGGDLLLHAVGDPGVHGGAAGQHSVGVQVLTDVNVALHDAVEGSLMDATRLHTWEVKVASSSCSATP